MKGMEATQRKEKQINHMHAHSIIAEDAMKDFRNLTYLTAINNGT
jgi:hypothetical protein